MGSNLQQTDVIDEMSLQFTDWSQCEDNVIIKKRVYLNNDWEMEQIVRQKRATAIGNFVLNIYLFLFSKSSISISLYGKITKTLARYLLNIFLSDQDSRTQQQVQ